MLPPEQPQSAPSASADEVIECLGAALIATRSTPSDPRKLNELLTASLRLATELEKSGNHTDAEVIRYFVFRICGEPDPPPYAALAMPVPRGYQRVDARGSFVESESA